MNQKSWTNHRYGKNTEKKNIKELFQRTMPNPAGFMGELFPALMEQIIPMFKSVPEAGKHFNLRCKINSASRSKSTKIVQNWGKSHLWLPMENPQVTVSVC